MTPPNQAPSDAALVAAVRTGQTSAFEMLVRRYERPARATCFGVLRDWHAAQDAAQEAFVAAYRLLSTLRDPAAFGAWLLLIARRRASRLARERRRLPVRLVVDVAASAVAPSDDDDELLALVAGLPPHDRATLLLRHVDGHSVAEIANVTGRSVGTVTKQLSRAHARLRERFARQEIK